MTGRHNDPLRQAEQQPSFLIRQTINNSVSSSLHHVSSGRLPLPGAVRPKFPLMDFGLSQIVYQSLCRAQRQGNNCAVMP